MLKLNENIHSLKLRLVDLYYAKRWFKTVIVLDSLYLNFSL